MTNTKITREEWLIHAVYELDKRVFSGDLNLEGRQFQIGTGRCPGSKNSEVVQPYDGEDVTLDDFFPTTMSVSWTIKDPIEILGNLALACIHGFFDEKRCSTKRFKGLAKKYGFDKPYNTYCGTADLKAKLEETLAALTNEYGAYPGKAVSFKKEEKAGNRKKSTLKIFCPECGFEMSVKRRMLEKHGNKLPICPCGSQMGLDLSDEEVDQNQDDMPE